MSDNVKIIAIAPNSIWAFIESEGKLYILQPPYFDQIEVTERDIEKILQLYLFIEYDMDFADLESAVEYLGSKYIELLEKRGIKTPSTEELKELLEDADDEILLEYLQRAKDELIPDGDLDMAETVIADIMALGRNNVEIGKMAADVLREIQKKRESVRNSITSEVKPKQPQYSQSRFPNIGPLEDVMKRATQAREEGVFPVGKAA